MDKGDSLRNEEEQGIQFEKDQRIDYILNTKHNFIPLTQVTHILLFEEAQRK